MIRQGLVGGGL